MISLSVILLSPGRIFRSHNKSALRGIIGRNLSSFEHPLAYVQVIVVIAHRPASRHSSNKTELFGSDQDLIVFIRTVQKHCGLTSAEPIRRESELN
jgi:hypothetical protein